LPRAGTVAGGVAGALYPHSYPQSGRIPSELAGARRDRGGGRHLSTCSPLTGA